MIKGFASYLNKFQSCIFIQVLRKSLVTLIPVLMIGACAVVLQEFPVDIYQNVIRNWCSGLLYDVLHMINNATFGMLAFYLAAVIGYHEGQTCISENFDNQYGFLIVSVGSYFILAGVPDNPGVFGAKGMFTAFFAAGFGCFLFRAITSKMKKKSLLTEGLDIRFYNALQTIFPAAIVLVIFVLLNYGIMHIFSVENTYEFLVHIVNTPFSKIHSDFLRGFCFILTSGILWFFGIHGSDVLESVSQEYFVEAMDKNIELTAQGLPANEIVTKPFLDCFILMGGCGATICLLLALLIFSKKASSRNISKMSAVPMFFNINEIIVFGLPIIFNPVFLIPFLAVPLINFCIAYLAMYTGLVPLTTHSVGWVTPILFSGYISTGSVRGILLQIVNLCVGTMIYAPFIKYHEKQQDSIAKRDYNDMVNALQRSEYSRVPISIVDRNASYCWMGRELAAELKQLMNEDGIELYYQPQYHSDGHCIGGEALFRWKQPAIGNIYPPLIFKLAEECGFLCDLEGKIVNKAVKDAKHIKEELGIDNLKISVNVTGYSIQMERFEQTLADIADRYQIKNMKICLEITEQAALSIDDKMTERFVRIRKMGYMLAVDDFSMGSTSIKYLTGKHFNLVKLDGALVKGIVDNERCCEIISSIINLCNHLELQVIAEYVSNEEIRNKLRELGCVLYQGWLYAPAVPYEEFVAIVKDVSNS